MPEEDASENEENASKDAKTENESYNNSVNTSKSNSLETHLKTPEKVVQSKVLEKDGIVVTTKKLISTDSESVLLIFGSDNDSIFF